MEKSTKSTDSYRKQLLQLQLESFDEGVDGAFHAMDYALSKASEAGCKTITIEGMREILRQIKEEYINATGHDNALDTYKEKIRGKGNNN